MFRNVKNRMFQLNGSINQSKTMNVEKILSELFEYNYVLNLYCVCLLFRQNLSVYKTMYY